MTIWETWFEVINTAKFQFLLIGVIVAFAWVTFWAWISKHALWALIPTAIGLLFILGSILKTLMEY